MVSAPTLKPNLADGGHCTPPRSPADAGFPVTWGEINIARLARWCRIPGQQVNWHYGFAAAGVGMLLGLVQYVWGESSLGTAGRDPAPATSADAFAALKRRTMGIVIATVVLLAVAGTALATGLLPFGASAMADAFGYVLLILTVLFFAWLFLSKGWTPDERNRLYVIAVFFLAAALFWSVFDHAGRPCRFDDRDRETKSPATPSRAVGTIPSIRIFIMALAPMAPGMGPPGRREPASPTNFNR